MLGVGIVLTGGKRFLVTLALALAAAVAALALIAATPASAASCPSFRVLHNDRIGAASFPAGNYGVTTVEGSKGGISCQEASRLFARFLEDWDGNLPNGWRVRPEGRGRASFARKSFPESPAEFTVRRTGGRGGGGNTVLGRLCNGTFTVNAGSRVGPLFFPRGRYLIYLPPRSGITCRRATVLFTRFLAQPHGTLPFPWRLRNQTATFFKPAHPTRSAFRIEPLNGT